MSDDAGESTGASSSSIVEFRDVGLEYDTGTRALAGVSLQVFEGEFLTLVGPSGCGKSTILRLVAGLSHPSDGQLVIDVGRRSSANPISVVFQDPTLLPWRSVESNVTLPLELRGVDRRSRRVESDRVLQLVRLGEHRRDLPRQLSGGMRMRVAIARALTGDPELLLMDEPFAALDEITRQAMQDELLRIWQATRCTIVFVTHSVSEAVFLSTRIAVMTPRPGRIAGVFDIALSGQREAELRTATEFTQLVASVSRTLHAHMEGVT